MKKSLLLSFVFTFMISAISFAQPANDNFVNAIDVSSIINSCSANAAYTTIGATSDVTLASCGNASGYNVWFKFTATATSMNVKVDRGGTKGSLRRVNLALFDSNGIELTCNRYIYTDDDVELANLSLTSGALYYVSVDNNGSGYRGTFTLCLNTAASYDYYEGAIDISSYINSCSADAAYTTVGATMDKNQGSCNNTSGYNRWFKFQATATSMNVKVDRGGTKGSLRRVNMALWESNGTTEVACNKYVYTDDDVEMATLALTIGNWYYVSVDNNGSGYRGTFTLCLNTAVSYDYYEGAIDISSYINSCSADAAYTTVGATMDKNQGSCNNTSGYNRWFKFQATATSMNVKVDRGGTKGSLRRVNMALWESNGTTEVACNKYVSTDDDVEMATLALTIGNWYYVSVDNNGSGYRGTFTLCLNTAVSYDYYEGAINVSSIIGSCSADAAYTTTGATMDQSNGSCSNASGYNRWFKFQATATTMNVTVDRGGTKGSLRRVNLTLWDSTLANEMACNRYVYTDDDVEFAALNLTIGDWYFISVDNNGSGYRGSFTLCLDTNVSYDYYEGAIDVSSIIGSCSSDAAYTTTGATMDQSNGSCSNASGYNRWFKFQATAATINVLVDRGGTKGSLRRVNLALWEADGITEIKCNRYVYTDNDVELAALTLTIGNWYYISVDNNGSGYRGSFTLCLDTNVSYDYYEGAKDVTSSIGTCSPDAAYTTVGATMDKANGSCSNASGYNRWFKFQASSTELTIKVDRGLTKGTLRRVNLTLWEANGSTEVACAKYVYTDDDVQLTEVPLTIGDWYYISVDNNGSGYRGSFTLCLYDYDFYEGAKDVTSFIGSCSPDAEYTTVGATMDMANGSCSNASGFNRWFKFQANSTNMNVTIDRGGSKGTLQRVNAVIWEADGTTEVSCNRYVYNADDIHVESNSLVIGDWYYISVDNYYSGAKGSFTLCLDTNLTYDYYEGAEDLSSYINSCSPDAAYTTIGGTMDMANGSCSNASGYNRWFKFQATDVNINVTIDRGGTKGTGQRFSATIWEADGSTQLACNRYVYNADDVTVEALGLTVGGWYYISVDNYYSGSRGSFTVCLDTDLSYDYLGGAEDLSSYIGTCSPDAAYTTIGATMDQSNGSCSNASGYNRWFKFQATHSNINVIIDRGGVKGSIQRVNTVIWDALDTSEVSCNRYVNNADVVEVASLGLTIGNWYYISVDNYYSGSRGSFTVCLDTTLSYDYLGGAIDVSSFIGSCSPDAAYTTIGATMDQSNGSCSNASGYNRWFKFQATATTLNLTVDRGGSKGTIQRVNAVIWDALDTSEVACNRYVNNADDVEVAALGLTIGNWYYISIDNYYSGSRGTFTLCLDTDLSYDYLEGAKDISAYLGTCTPDAAYTTIGATMDQSHGSCSNASGYNRWFKFQAVSPELNVTIDRGGTKGTIQRVNAVIWKASDTSEVACNRYVNNADIVEVAATTLTAGDWYYISVDNYYSGSRGTFTICLDTTPSYDYYEGAHELTDLNNFCSIDAEFTTIGATMDKNQGSCSNASGYNRWFKFTAIDAEVTYTVKRGGALGTIQRINTTLWEADGITELACAKYVSNTDDVSITYSSLTAGNEYYISVDNYYSGSRGTFTLCITNVGDEYYSIANGNWNSASTWSLVSHAGAASPTAPSVGDIVYIDGNSVTLTANDSCAEVNMDVSNGASSLSITGSTLTVMGSFNQNNSGFNNSNSVSLVSNGNLYINDSYNMDRSGGNSALQFSSATGSTLSINQDFVMNTSGGTMANNTVTFDGTSALTINGNVTMSHSAGMASDLTFNNTSIATVFGDFTFSAVADGKLSINLNNTSSLTVYEGFAKGTPGYGSITCYDNSTIKFWNLEAGSNVPKNSEVGTTDLVSYQNVVFHTINPSYTLTVDHDLVIDGDLTLMSIMDMNIDASGSVQIDGTLTNNGTLTVEVGGSLVQTHTGASNVTGSGFTVKQTGQGSNMAYNIWSSPIENAGILSSFTGVNPCDVYVVNAATQEWKYDYTNGFSTTCNGNSVTFGSTDVISGGDGVMDIARGYFVPGASSATRTFNGKVYDGDLTIPIYGNNIVGTPAVDWVLSDQNLVGNPYPSGLDLSTFWTANSSNLQGGIHFYDHNTTSYVTWTSGGGTGPDYVAVAQGFWVEADASAFTAPAPNNLVFNNAMRSTSVDAFYKTENVNHNIVLSINSPAGLSIRMLVGYHNNATNQDDKGYDARVFGANPNLKFASVLDGKDFVVQNVAPLSFGDQKVFPLTVFTTETGTHTFIEYKRENLNVDVYIRDNQTGAVHNINDGNYSVNLVANQDYSGRFDIVFVNTASKDDTDVSDKGTTTAVEETTTSKYLLLSNTNGYTLVNTDGINGDIQVIDVTGKIVWTKNNVHANQVNITLDGVSTGIYFINVINNGEKVYNNKVVKN